MRRIKKFSLPNSIFVYGDKVAIIIWSKIPLGIVIENGNIANSFKQYFETILEIAKK